MDRKTGINIERRTNTCTHMQVDKCTVRDGQDKITEVHTDRNREREMDNEV